MRLAIRGYAWLTGIGRVQRFEDLVNVPALALDEVLPELAKKHGRALAGDDLQMIEIEFIDEPDERHRFFRFGTSPLGLVMPLAVDLDKLGEGNCQRWDLRSYECVSYEP